MSSNTKQQIHKVISKIIAFMLLLELLSCSALSNAWALTVPTVPCINDHQFVYQYSTGHPEHMDTYKCKICGKIEIFNYSQESCGPCNATNDDFHKYNSSYANKLGLLAKSMYGIPSDSLLNELGMANNVTYFSGNKTSSNASHLSDMSTDYRGMVGYSADENVLTIAFQGSQGINGWANNFDFINTETGVHKAFYETIESFMKTFLKMSFVMENGKSITVDDLLKITPPPQILITGHSQGGALAQVLHWWLSENYADTRSHICTYTYASPIPFDASAHKDAALYNCYNIINPNDIVPYVGICTSSSDPSLSHFVGAMTDVAKLAEAIISGGKNKVLWAFWGSGDDLRKIEKDLNYLVSDDSEFNTIAQELIGKRFDETLMFGFLKNDLLPLLDELGGDSLWDIVTKDITEITSPFGNPIGLYAFSENKEQQNALLDKLTPCIIELYGLLRNAKKYGTRLGTDIVPPDIPTFRSENFFDFLAKNHLDYYWKLLNEEEAPEKYIIRYDLAGGSGDFQPLTKAVGQDIYLSTQNPVRYGFQFAGWSYQSPASPDAVDYYAGGKYWDDAWWENSGKQDITLYAAWRQDSPPQDPWAGFPGIPVLSSSASMLRYIQGDRFAIDKTAAYCSNDFANGINFVVSGDAQRYSLTAVVLKGEPLPSNAEAREALLYEAAHAQAIAFDLDLDTLSPYAGKWLKLYVAAENDVGSRGAYYYLRLNDQDAAGQSDILDSLTYDSASAAGDVTNVPKPSEPTQEELNTFSVTPIEAVLVLDASGSMDRRNPNNGKSVLSYAQDAAVAFAQTLFSLNPESRISVVAYDDDVATVCPLTNAKDSIALQASIRAIRTGGSTNTGGGYERAGEILHQQAQNGLKRVVLMLSDGLANTGPDAVTEGRRVSQAASVYTIGLVGGMSASEKEMARGILRKGYQTQCFEIDFSSVSDISLYLAESFIKIAMAGGQDARETYYSLRVDGSMEVRVAHASGQTLCSAPDMLSTASGYGVLHFLGDEMDDKLLVLRGDDYDILLRGSYETAGSYALTGFNSVGADTQRLLDSQVMVHPATCIALRVKDGMVTLENILFNPIDPYAIDPFTGVPTKGLSLAAQGYATSNTAVYAANHKKAAVLEKLSKNTPLNVFALDPSTGWYLVGVTSGDGMNLRGWADGKTLDIKGYVPEMQFIGGEYTLAESSPLHLAPSHSSRVADQIAIGTVVELAHVERDRPGEEWAYVKTAVKNKDTWGYMPARMLAGFQSIAPEDFRLGGDMPLKVYDKTFGENKYSEWMWASSPEDLGSGVILSGRTASTKGDITKALGGRDAWIMRLDEKGDVSKVLTTGGSEVDSYHCVLHTEQGYLVSGITRSQDMNFQGIWDTGYYMGTVPKKLSWSNALIGLLDERFEPIWQKSFGTGSGSYGFDMVLKLMDGSIAGVGWSTAGRGSVLSDHGKQDFYAVKLSQSGQVLAMNCYGGAMDDVPDGGVATKDGGILMIGRTASGHLGGGKYDGYALKLDASLAIEWEFSYGGNGEDTFDNVRMLDDGTYLVTGFTNSTTGTGAGTAKGGMDFWAMRIDQFGRPIWNLRYGGSGDEELRGTTLLKDGRLILVGDTTSQDGQVRGYQRAGGKAAPTDGWAVCINETGKVLWQYCLGGTGNDYFNSAAIDPADGGLVLAGVKDKKNDENAKAWVVKIQMPEY